MRPPQRSNVIGRTTHCGGSRSRSGCCGQPGLWRSMASMPTPSWSSCPNTSPWEFASPVASPYGSELVSPILFFRQWWASAGCSVSLSFFHSAKYDISFIPNLSLPQQSNASFVVVRGFLELEKVWPWCDLNSQPTDPESDTLPLCHSRLCFCYFMIQFCYLCLFCHKKIRISFMWQ